MCYGLGIILVLYFIPLSRVELTLISKIDFLSFHHCVNGRPLGEQTSCVSCIVYCLGFGILS
jgi:hypothetical protein